MPPLDLSIITVTYQSKEYIDACILSVVTRTFNCTYEHIIIDNASTDGTVELVEGGYSSYVRLIKNQSNHGFASANQQGVKEAKGRYLLFLNPDMQLHEGTLDSLLNWIEKRPEVGLASCKLLCSSETPHPALRPSKFPSLLPYLPALLKLRPFFCSVHPKFFYPTFDDNQEQEVEVVRGAFMLIRREVIQKLGFAFNPRYFILFEDIDTCREVRRLGYKVVYTPLISCIDFFGRSFLKQTSAWKYLQMTRSFKLYVSRWHSPLHLLWINPAATLGFLFRIPEWGLKNSWSALRSKR
ncbi:MAG: glycosyltransferase family 2 protein [Chlamydiales bacterium]|nr:glycosyltransferase family 2 protein [Chlamydiales bacterium]